MRRLGGLWEDVCAPENFRSAYLKARCGKRLAAEAVSFGSDLHANLAVLRQAVADESWNPGAFRTFMVTDPKPRIISAAPFPDRIVHHALMNVTGAVFERSLIHHTYACRLGKGTHAAVLHAFSRCKASPWFVKLDVRKYFDSIQQRTILVLLEGLFRERPLLRTFERIVQSYQTIPYHGVPIGNLTSQYFANHYLSAFDHMVLERLRPAGYVRYMDDMVLWGAEKAQIRDWAAETREYLATTRGLELKQPLIGRSSLGLPFLGFRVTSRGIYLSSRSKRRFRGKYRALENARTEDRITESEAARRVSALVAATALARARTFRYNVVYGAVLRQ